MAMERALFTPYEGEIFDPVPVPNLEGIKLGWLHPDHEPSDDPKKQKRIASVSWPAHIEGVCEMLVAEQVIWRPFVARPAGEDPASDDIVVAPIEDEHPSINLDASGNHGFELERRYFEIARQFEAPYLGIQITRQIEIPEDTNEADMPLLEMLLLVPISDLWTLKNNPDHVRKKSEERQQRIAAAAAANAANAAKKNGPAAPAQKKSSKKKGRR